MERMGRVGLIYETKEGNRRWGVGIGKQLLVAAMSSIFFVPLLLYSLIHSIYVEQGKLLTPLYG